MPVNNFIFPAWLVMALAIVGVGTFSAPLHAANAPGRLAYIADGNNNDKDDYCGTPVGLAILRAKGLQAKLVHYSHSCDLSATDTDREKIMQEACDGTASRWGGFSHITFYNLQRQYNAAKTHLAAQINSSSATDPLYIIGAGEHDIIYDSLATAQSSKRQYVYYITHHPNNDGAFDKSKQMADSVSDFNLKVIRIVDQNFILDDESPYSSWYWARDSKDTRLNWLWERGKKEMTQKPNFDCSDAGMIWYWSTGANTNNNSGDQEGEVSDIRKLLEGYVSGGGSSNVAPTVSLTSPTNNAKFTQPASIRITANATDSDGSISKVEFRANGTLIGTENGAPYDWTWTNVSAGTYSIVARAFDNQGATKDSSPVSVTVATAQAGLPAPWISGDVGSVTPAGSATHASGVYTVKGAGNDIWGTADGFHFVSQKISGDGEIIARVSALQNTHAWAKAGVMIRESRSAGSKYAAMVLTPARGASFQRRVATNDTSAGTAASDTAAPYWVRLKRTGNTLTGYRSANGTSWDQVGSATVTMSTAVEIGLAVTSHADGKLTTAKFDSVKVSQSTPPAQPFTITLMNADNEGVMAGYNPIVNNTTIDLSSLPTANVNIRANVSGVGSVQFQWTGAESGTKIENASPYAMKGNSNGNYAPWTPTLGTYKLTITTYSGAKATGSVLQKATYSFKVIDSAPAAIAGNG